MGKKTPKITDGGVAKVKPAVTKPQNSAASSIPPSTSKVGKKKDNQRIDETPEMAIASSSIAPKKAKASAEIDGLFGQLKNNTTKKQTPKNETAQQMDGPSTSSAAATAPKAKPPRVAGSKEDIFGTETGKTRKKTEEGYSIYHEDELGLGKKGGDTDLCPFDCDCCF